MQYRLLRDVIDLLAAFEEEALSNGMQADIKQFKRWLAKDLSTNAIAAEETDWVGKRQGRSADSVISTLFVHVNRYAKMYAKAAMQGSSFATQEEFIYLINLQSFGPMGKMELIKSNIQEKPVGMQIIRRLLNQGWVKQRDSQRDKRSKIIEITDAGIHALAAQMPKIRQATQLIGGDLRDTEKLELIRLMTKLDNFHKPIYYANHAPANLLDLVADNYLTPNN
ncbi:MarR family winged helix-turn-helix transcriptional regulator [Sphingobacterium griseoflavum]|nr:MarR family winged helix-turn-helix transcriptional regulator [Sphingobacterium griseoflavum]